jgi:hypothetical protein
VYRQYSQKKKEKKSLLCSSVFFHELRKKEAEKEETKCNASKAKTSHVSDDAYTSILKF